MATSFCKIHLGKPIEEVDAATLIDYFQQAQKESTTLEFKSYGTRRGEPDDFSRKTNGVLKAICAMLNSSGGLVVWGAPVGRKIGDDLEDAFQGDIVGLPSDKRQGKDSLVSKISTRIKAMPTNFRVEEVALPDDTYVYLFECQESTTKPHQFDDRYWIRLDGQSKPAEHYIVDALFKQIKYTELRGKLMISMTSVGPNIGPILEGNLIKINFKVAISNKSINLNDSALFFSLHSNPNWIHRSTDGKLDYLFRVEDACSVLTYGLPYINNEYCWVINQNTLENNGIVRLYFVFGSKLSPAKVCRYTVSQLRSFDYSENQIIFGDPSEYINLIREENYPITHEFLDEEPKWSLYTEDYP